ncbi:acetyl ornithine aminotransferase family protein [Tunturiibacter gelidoferens]|uniref:4-aminobutyrate aminotransferase n=1 Tax=Tunturiibacter gelidiferens TaxID=3069689 RepID=A0A9X0U404_9BACT|nr:acetyl ornithine aminotransferase family protein [Edaphobacter lichenicola]MBB5328971.1 4-aminobutyrate aminotransferase [Edaphobacter lichenicola]
MTTLTEKTLEDLKQNSAQGVTHAAGEAIRSKHYTEFGPRLKTALPGPKATKIVADDDRLISPSYTRSYPMVAKSGRGVRVTDVDGNEFLDFAAGIAVNSTGHCHPEVVKAIQDQAAELIHMSGTDFYYENMTILAERLSAIAPMPGPHKFYYGNSGAEAVECAMKLARYHTGRQNIISFFGAFHGRTMGALSLTGSKPQQKRRFAPLVPGVHHIRYPYAYRGCPDGTPEEQEAFALECARYIEDRLFKTILPPEEVAAIILEPIQGEGGYVVAPTNFLQEIRRICDRHGILLIADEVQSGAARTGKWWAIEHSGVHPDIVCIAKGIASGMPLGICMSKAEIMSWVPGSHASTFGGNPICIAAALATLDILEREGLQNAATIGEKMLSRLRPLVAKHPTVGDVRGRGLMIGIELVKDKQSRTPVGPMRDKVVDLAFERGLLILGCGETTIRLCPPLIVNEHEANVALDILEECITLAAK